MLKTDKTHRERVIGSGHAESMKVQAVPLPEFRKDNIEGMKK